jgi:hypothetical protein
MKGDATATHDVMEREEESLMEKLCNLPVIN